MASSAKSTNIREDILKLKQDLNVIKHILSEEGKLTPWAKRELAKARAEPISSYVDLDDI